MQSRTCVHVNAGRKVLRYLKGTFNHCLFYDKMNDLIVSAFIDVDWTGSLNDRRSTSGYVFLLGTTTISWSSIVAISSTKVEYRVMANATCEAMWIKKLMKDLCIENLQIIIYCDNMSSIYLANNPVFHARTKHIEVHYHFVREKVLSRDIEKHYVKIDMQVVDMFTKFLDSTRIKQFKEYINLQDIQ